MGVNDHTRALQVPGRMYPVEVEFVPLPEDQLLYKDLAKPASAADAEATAAAPDGTAVWPQLPTTKKPCIGLICYFFYLYFFVVGAVARPLPKAGGPLNPKPYLAIMQRIDEQFPQEERGDLLVHARTRHTRDTPHTRTHAYTHTHARHTYTRTDAGCGAAGRYS